MDQINLLGFKINSEYPSVNSEISSWWEPFATELQEYSRRSWDGEPWRLYSETPMLCFLSNSIIRNDKEFRKSIIQEFCINESGSHLGRCDLLLITGEGDHRNAYLIEGKFYKNPTYGIKEWSIKEYDRLVKDIEIQAESYYNADIKSFEHYKTVIIIALGFYYAQYDGGQLKGYLKRYLAINNPEINTFYGVVASENPFNESYKKNESCLEIFGSVRIIENDKQVQ